uniref:Family with sequence similarity 189 member B n=1 Tax=Calidris pygmaea TaxID=425635 RepID=A0A8C3K081_9CHAR
MPSPSDSSRSLTGRTSRSLTHLRVQRTWLQILLVLGFIQVILGVLIVTFSLVAATITPSAKIRHSCPSWAGFSDLLFSVCGLTVLSTIICTLSAVFCCIQIFSLDIVHVVSRKVSWHLMAVSVQGCAQRPACSAVRTVTPPDCSGLARQGRASCCPPRR